MAGIEGVLCRRLGRLCCRQPNALCGNALWRAGKQTIYLHFAAAGNSSAHADGCGSAGRVLRCMLRVQAVLSALTSFQFIVIPVASYVLLGEEVTCTALVCIAVVLFGA